MLDSLVRVSRRVAHDHYASILANKGAVLSPGWSHDTEGYNTPQRKSHSYGLSPTAQTDAGLTSAECTGEEHQVDQLRASLVASASLSTISRTF
jgi:hypothetical protein